MSNKVSGVENVVVVSDYEDNYIELPGLTAKSDIAKKYDLIYTYRDGKKMMLEEYPEGILCINKLSGLSDK